MRVLSGNQYITLRALFLGGTTLSMPIPEEVRVVLLTEVRARLRNMDMEFLPAPGDEPDVVRALLSAECTSFVSSFFYLKK